MTRTTRSRRPRSRLLRTVKPPLREVSFTWRVSLHRFVPVPREYQGGPTMPLFVDAEGYTVLRHRDGPWQRCPESRMYDPAEVKAFLES